MTMESSVKSTVRHCPVCLEPRAQILHTQQLVAPDFYPSCSSQEIAYCENCGFVYTDSGLTQADFDAYYARHSRYADGKTSTGSGDLAWDVVRLDQTAGCIAAQLPSRGARILEIGCANGGLLLAIKRLGYENLVGMDPSPDCVQNASRAGLQAVQGLLSSIPAGIGTFDCVILCGVIEHVFDLRGAVNVMRGLVSERGCIYLDVPDASRYVDAVVSPFQDFNTEHINHFSLAGLDNLMSLIGFETFAAGTKAPLSPPPFPYPAAYCFARAAGPESPRPQLKKDMNLRERIGAYIQRSNQIIREIDARLRAQLKITPQIIVWGTGQLAMKLLADTVLRDAQIAAFVDGSTAAQGGLLRGMPILSPSEAGKLPYPIVITSILHEDAIVEVIRKKLSLPNLIISLRR